MALEDYFPRERAAELSPLTVIHVPKHFGDKEARLKVIAADGSEVVDADNYTLDERKAREAMFRKGLEERGYSFRALFEAKHSA